MLSFKSRRQSIIGSIVHVAIKVWLVGCKLGNGGRKAFQVPSACIWTEQEHNRDDEKRSCEFENMSQKYTEKKAMAHVKMVTVFFLNSIVDKFYIFLGLVFHYITFPSTNLFFTNNFGYDW